MKRYIYVNERHNDIYIYIYILYLSIKYIIYDHVNMLIYTCKHIYGSDGRSTYTIERNIISRYDIYRVI